MFKIKLKKMIFLVRVKLGLASKAVHSYLLFEIEQPFNHLYSTGMKISNTPDSGVRRRARFYNLIGFLKSVNRLEGAIVECGCWKGLSSYLMCNYIKLHDKSFDGKDFYVVDSFEGLSNPSDKDVITENLIDNHGERKGAAFKSKGAYSAQLENIKRVLSDFPRVSYYKGWIPETLVDLPMIGYKFVHIDLDLYEPIIGSLEYFYPKLVKGGVVVCDDYGSLYWPGAKKAVEEFAKNHNLQFISLSSGQAIFIKG